MDVVGKLVDELLRDPKRFHDAGGYDRLLDALREGNAPDALRKAVSNASDLAGDLLWVVCELQSVEPFVSAARLHLTSPDTGTAAYAMEVVLRGGQHRSDLRAAFDQLLVSGPAVCEHSVRALGQDITRLIAILETVGCDWSCTLAKALAPSMEPFCREELEDLVEGLVEGQACDRQVVGLALATLMRREDGTYLSLFSRSDEAWIREYGTWLKRLGEPVDLAAIDAQLKSLGISVDE